MAFSFSTAEAFKSVLSFLGESFGSAVDAIPEVLRAGARRIHDEVAHEVGSMVLDEAQRRVLAVLFHPGPDSWVPPGAAPQDVLRERIQPGAETVTARLCPNCGHEIVGR